jgi:ParB family chromosome partitioning protein
VQIEEQDIKQLIQDPANCRTHDEKNIKAIKASLETFGQQKPIVIDKENKVIAGNGTLQAAQELGWKKIKAVVSQLLGKEQIAYAIADNRTAELADWDKTVLVESLSDLEDALQAACGFNKNEMKKLVASITQDELDLADDMGDLEYRVITTVDGPDTQEKLMVELESRGYKCLPLMS